MMPCILTSNLTDLLLLSPKIDSTLVDRHNNDMKKQNKQPVNRFPA